MKKLAFTIAIVLTACGTDGAAGPVGPAGPTGPTGPAGSYTKGDIYCTGALPAVTDTPGASEHSSWSITASCLDQNDLPLTGACQNGATPLPPEIWLAVDGPIGWLDEAQPAAWLCQWRSTVPLPLPGYGETRATICCIAQ